MRAAWRLFFGVTKPKQIANDGIWRRPRSQKGRRCSRTTTIRMLVVVLVFHMPTKLVGLEHFIRRRLSGGGRGATTTTRL